MKKRLLSALLALALVFVLLPTTALADTTPVTDENVKINGTPVTVGNGISLGEGNGTYSYDKSTRTLTLNNATINATDSNIGISFGVPVMKNIDYKIELIGTNTISSTSAQAIYVEYDTSVDACENNTMKRSTLTINGSAGSSLSLNVSGTGSKEAIEAIWSKGDFTLSGGTAVTAFSSDKIAVNVGSMTINNSKLSAQSSSYGTTVVLYGLKMIGDTAEFEALNTSSVVSAVLGTSGASENTDWSNYQFTTGSYSGGVLTKSDPEVCSRETLNKYLGLSQKEKSQYIHIAKRTIALETTSDVYIAGGPAVVGQWTTITANSCSGSYYYDAAKKELTLKDVNITRNNNNINHAIQFTKNGDYTINLEGTNNISSVTNGICALNGAFYDNPANISVTITGTGSLNVTANTYAIDMQVGDLIFNSTGNITLTTNRDYRTNTLNALHVAGSISIDNAKYDIVGKRQDADGTTETISDSSEFDPAYLNGYTVGGETTLFKTITITPAAAKDSTISYGKKTLKQGEIINGENGGTATVDSKNNTITLDNFKGDKALVFNAEFTPNSITLIGDSTLSAVETKYQDLTISVSGSGSLTVGSIKVHNQKTSSDDKPNLTITGAAQVTVNRPSSEDLRAIDIDGDLTVINSGSLTATSTSDSVPTVQVGGNATFTGSTVTITNNSTTQGERYKDSYEVSSALHVDGDITISGGTVTAEAKAGGDAIRAVGNITVSNDATVTAKNNSQYFNAITAGSATGGEVNTLYNLIVSGENTRITATNTHDNNLTYGGAINAYIENANEGYYLKANTDSKAIAPNDSTTVRSNSLTITRGDEVTRTNSPVVIAGTTLLNDTYYTINGSTVAKGSKNDYNALYDSETKTLKLNNAKISTTTKNAAIKISEDLTITVTGTNELKGNYNHCIESYNNFTINGTGTLNMTNTSSSSSAASVIWCGPYKSLTIAAEVIIKNEAQPGNLIFTVEKDAYSFAEGYNVYASTDVSGSPLEAYDAAKGSTYKYLCITKENLAPTTPTTYTVTITAGDNMNRESGALTQEVTKGAAITEVKFVAASGHYFPADYVSKMNLPAGLTAEIRENSWYLIISGTPTSDVTINLPAASVRPTITVSMPTPAAGNTPATANDITLTYSDINKSISKNLTISNVVWQSYVSNGDGSITLGEILSNGDKFVEGTKYRVTIDFEGVSEDYAIVPAAGTTKWSNAEWGWSTMTLYFDATGAPCTHQYTNDWHANGNTHWHECELCKAHADEAEHTYGDWIIDIPATDTTDGSKHRICSVCQYQETASIPKTGTGEIVPPTPDNPGTIVIIRPAEEEKPAQQPNPSTGANDLVGMAVAAAVVAVLGSVALLRKHD